MDINIYMIFLHICKIFVIFVIWYGGNFMTTFDLNYICSSIGNLSGIPVRLYENNQELLFFSMVKLPKDPMIIYKEKILWEKEF